MNIFLGRRTLIQTALLTVLIVKSFREKVVSNQEWISCKEAANILKETEETIINMLQQGIIQGKNEDGAYFVDKSHLIAWNRHRKRPHVEVAEIFSGIRGILLEHHKTIFAKEQAQHPGIRGTLHENLVRNFLREQLPQKFYLGAGQVISSNQVMDENKLIQNLSNQIDIVIFDALNHPILLPHYELYPIEGTLAVIEVKSHLNKATLVGTKEIPGALSNIRSAKRLISSEAQSFVHPPYNISFEGERFDLRQIPSPLGIIFAFSSIHPRKLASYWVEWNQTVEERYRVDLICLLENAALLIDSTRFHRLFDVHQISTLEPIASANVNEIVCIRSPAILFFFFNLLLRDLRKMSEFSQRFTATTPSSYLQNVALEPLFTMSNALDPNVSDDLEYLAKLVGDAEDKSKARI